MAGADASGLPPRQQLNLTVHQANGVRAADRGGTSDPYLVVSPCLFVARKAAAVSQRFSMALIALLGYNLRSMNNGRAGRRSSRGTRR